MPVTVATDKKSLIQQAGQLLEKRVYSVSELEDFRKKAKAFREGAASLLGAPIAASSPSELPKDLLDWVEFEKNAVRIIQNSLSAGDKG
ncbi:MAG TPA: hypothetical protein VLK33_13485 [Terriglobales bacterium]|nr:hypothetical protein [Terriglobales bacterium]